MRVPDEAKAAYPHDCFLSLIEFSNGETGNKDQQMKKIRPSSVNRLRPLVALMASVGLAAVTAQFSRAADSNAVVVLDPASEGRIFEGLGALSAGASSRLLPDYPEPARSQVLDYLFKPNFGASLHHLKVEIGGDVNSTDGTEQSHMRTREDENYQRGYEWWLMKEARRRNPKIILDALQWGAPGWIGEGQFYSQDNADFVCRFVKGAKSVHDLDIQYVGIWNETGYDTDYIKLLRKTLDREGLGQVRISAADEVHTWSIADRMKADPQLAAAIHTAGSHYPKFISTEVAKSSGKPLWASEDGSVRGTWPGASVLAKSYNRNYVMGRMTKTIVWSPVNAYYGNLVAPGCGLMDANTPWSGFYDVQPAIWVTGHTTQFAQPGWKYLDPACGLLPGGGSHVALVAPGGKDWSLVIETMDAKAPQAFSFRPAGTLKTGTLHLWKTSEQEQFVQLPGIAAADGLYRVTLEPNCIYSITTTTGQRKGEAPVPAAAPFPARYQEDFESCQPGTMAKYLADQGGGFEVAPRQGGGGQALRQVIFRKGIPWVYHVNPDPETIAGNVDWRDYEVGMDALIEKAGYVVLFGRIARVMGIPQFEKDPNGYALKVSDSGEWQLRVAAKVLASGKVSFAADRWHALKLRFEANKIQAFINQELVADLSDGTCEAGMIGFGSGYHGAQFDNIAVKPISPMPEAAVLDSPQGGWTARISPDGSFQGLEMTFGGKRIPVPWRQDARRGPAWEGVTLARKPGPGLEFEGRSASGQVYSLSYKDDSGRLTITAGIRNDSDKAFTVKPRARLTLGLDHEMKNPKTYFDIFFPTMLRSEKTHFWGYFQSPHGQVLAIASPDPIASWQRGYIDLGHHIATSHLDLMHAPPLPPRHPHNLDTLAPGAARSWRIALQAVTQIEEVNPVAAKICGAPVFILDRTMAAAGETVDVKVLPGSATKPTVTATDAKGQPIALVESESKDGAIRATFSVPEAAGLVTLRAVADGKESEALVYIRKPWGWYLKQARSEALRMQQKPSQHRESWMGLFSAYWAHLYFPDPQMLAETEKVFGKVFNTMVNPATGDYYRTHPSVKIDHFVEWGATRPQNTSWMVGLLVARYAATRDVKHLELASAWGDKLIQKFQRPNGAFEGYTALTLGAKFLQELAWYERPLSDESAVWRERYDRHMESVERASKNMAVVKDLGETEGGSTYEDTQAGSAWSLLALHALTAQDASLRAAYLADSLLVRGRHECLTQALVPDARMRGGTLRWWEAQYDVPPMMLNMMNSPHGWTMRSQFGALYLYLLTGEERYLNLVHNAMGACAQAIEHESGTLRWAFIPDPYIWDGKFVTKPIGEQWLPMVSDRRRIADGKIATLFAEGWSCDNDVHEHFRVLTEQFIPNAFVLERADGSLRAWNCQVERKDGRILVRPSEPVVSRVHFNLKQASPAEVAFASGVVREELKAGMHWVGPGVKGAIAPDIYLCTDEQREAQ
jgi:galactosylceramidase